MNNDMLLDQDPRYEMDHPKLQWLFVLIPVIGLFILYIILRFKQNRRRRREFLEIQPSHVLVNSVAATNSHSGQMISTEVVLPPPPVYSVCSPPKYEDIVIEHQERAYQQ
jgi:hypothetical protein